MPPALTTSPSLIPLLIVLLQSFSRAVLACVTIAIPFILLLATLDSNRQLIINSASEHKSSSTFSEKLFDIDQAKVTPDRPMTSSNFALDEGGMSEPTRATFSPSSSTTSMFSLDSDRFALLTPSSSPSISPAKGKSVRFSLDAPSLASPFGAPGSVGRRTAGLGETWKGSRETGDSKPGCALTRFNVRERERLGSQWTMRDWRVKPTCTRVDRSRRIVLEETEDEDADDEDAWMYAWGKGFDDDEADEGLKVLLSNPVAKAYEHRRQRISSE